MDYALYPPIAAADIARLRRRIAASGIPAKQTDRNLVIGTWNIRHFGRVHPSWGENPDSPKRNLRGMAYIAEVARLFDILAIQEVKRNTSGLRMLVDRSAGEGWGLIVSDVTSGSGGNTERLAFIYDERRVQPSGLAGEIVLPPTELGDPAGQFARTPYIVGFRAREERFALLTTHIKYGDVPQDRLQELRDLADYVAHEIRDRASVDEAEESNLIVLGDFNIDGRINNPLFRAFVATGLVVPPQLWNLRTTYNTKPKYYDQIAWFDQELELPYTGRAGTIDFVGSLYQEITDHQMTFRVSDHFPLWAEFGIDRSTAKLVATLSLDPLDPDPLSAVPD
jgi:endonuclease/exonuclease/phosphatase family metal-dependent hydrolase